MLFGVDASQVQGPIDWVRARDEGGVAFAFVKVSEGLGGVDPRALENLAGARAAGIIEGVYHFARLSQGRPRDQLHKLWDSLGEQLPRLSPVLDLESAPDATTPQQIVDFGAEWADECERYFGPRGGIVYTYPDFARRRLVPALTSDAGRRLARCPLWMAHYLWIKPGTPPIAVQPYVPPPWKVWTFWQISGGGDPKRPELDGPRVPGIPWVVDRNVFAGDLAALRALCGLPDVPLPEGAIVHPAVPLGLPGMDPD